MNLDFVPIELKVREYNNELLTNYRTEFRFDQKIEDADKVVLDLFENDGNKNIDIEYFYKNQKLDKNKKLYNYFGLFKNEYENERFIGLDIFIIFKSNEKRSFQQSSNLVKSQIKNDETKKTTENEKELIFCDKFEKNIELSEKKLKNDKLKKNLENDIPEIKYVITHFLRRNFTILDRISNKFCKQQKLQPNELSQIITAFLFSCGQYHKCLTFFNNQQKSLSNQLLEDIFVINQATFRSKTFLFTQTLNIYDKFLDSYSNKPQKDTLYFQISINKISVLIIQSSFVSVIKFFKVFRTFFDNENSSTAIFLSEAYYYAALSYFHLGNNKDALKCLKLGLKNRLKICSKESRGCSKYYELFAWISIEISHESNIIKNYEAMISKEMDIFRNIFSFDFYIFWQNYCTFCSKNNIEKTIDLADVDFEIIESMFKLYKQILPVKFFLEEYFLEVSKLIVQSKLRTAKNLLMNDQIDKACVEINECSKILDNQSIKDFSYKMLKMDFLIIQRFCFKKPKRIPDLEVIAFIQELLNYAHQNFGKENMYVQKISHNISLLNKN